MWQWDTDRGATTTVPRIDPVDRTNAKWNFFLLNLCLVLHVAILISYWFPYIISQMKENKFLDKFMVYYLCVEIIPWDLWSNWFTSKLRFCILYIAYLLKATAKPHQNPWHPQSHAVCAIDLYILCFRISKALLEEQI